VKAENATTTQARSDGPQGITIRFNDDFPPILPTIEVRSPVRL
jgi:hypothetical protein